MAIPRADLRGVPQAQLVLMSTTPQEGGEYGWLGACEAPGRGPIFEVLTSEVAIRPSGWETFDIIDFRAGSGDGGGTAVAAAATPVKEEKKSSEPPAKRAIVQHRVDEDP